MEDKNILKAVEIIQNSNRIVAFTGAGASTESGIEDFRSEGGLWSKYDPSIYASYQYFLIDPSKFWEMHGELVEILENAKPNPVHFGLVELEKMGKMKAIITQNIDNLHKKAGSGTHDNIPIYELHGTYTELECLECKKQFKFDEVNYKDVAYPTCECGGYIKPKVVLFGESLPYGVLEGAIESCKDCDCFLMIGSSLVVSPANFLPSIAKETGAKVIFINKDTTTMDFLADIFLQGKAGEIFSKLIELLQKK
ncbi:MAG: NAD-dependent protein deacylase [Candidatus Helarchaeota archaeon]